MPVYPSHCHSCRGAGGAAAARLSPVCSSAVFEFTWEYDNASKSDLLSSQQSQPYVKDDVPVPEVLPDNSGL